MRLKAPPRLHIHKSLRACRGFSLVELLVVIAITGVLMAMLLPAIQQIRAAAQKMNCANHLKQISHAMHNYHNDHDRFPYGRKFDRPHSYSWYQPVLPYLEAKPVHQGYTNLNDPNAVTLHGDDARLDAARTTLLPYFFCPSDTGPLLNEASDGHWRRTRGNYRVCVGTGDLYGNVLGNLDPKAFGVFNARVGQAANTAYKPMQTRIEDIRDGVTNTILLSEGLNPTSDPYGPWPGPIGDIQLGNMGGAFFSTAELPNSKLPDRVRGLCPQDVGDSGYLSPCQAMALNRSAKDSDQFDAYAAARSRHLKGVNVALADGSVRFVADSISLATWRAGGTRSGGEPPPSWDVGGVPPGSGIVVPKKPPGSILFIGNSYTEGHNLPQLVAELAKAAGEKPPPEIEMHAVGGQTLEGHWNDGQALQQIKSRKWDYVILQEQSMRPIIEGDAFLAYAKKFGGAINANGSKPMFFMTWARQNLPETQKTLADAYNSAAASVGGEVAPVGLAWQRSLESNPSLTLHQEDMSHPNERGAYLTACVFYAKIYGKSPVGLPSKVGSISLPANEAKYLQEIAAGVGK